MSIRDLRPWELDDAPADSWTLHLAVLAAVVTGRQEAEAEYRARRTERAAAERKTARDDGFEAAEAAFLKQEGGGD